jgi:WD40 repeat protein
MWPVIAAAVVASPGADRYGDPLPAGATARLGTVRFRLGWVGGLHFAPDGTTVRGVTSEPAFTEWDAATGRRLRATRWPGRLPKSPGVVLFSDDGTTCVYYTTGDERVTVVDTATGRTRSVFRLPRQTDLMVRNPLSPDGRYIVEYDADSLPDLRVWDTATGRSRPVPRNGRLTSENGLTFAPDGRFLIGTGGETMLYDPATGNAVWTAPFGDLNDPRFTRDGRWVVTDTPRPRLWDAATGKPTDRPPDPDAPFPADGIWTVSLDGRRGVRRSGTTFEVWDLAARKWLAGDDNDRGHQFEIEAVAVSTKGVVATVNEVEGVRLWDATAGRPLAAVPVPDLFDVNAIRFTPDGRRVVVGYGHPAFPLLGRGDEYGLTVVDVASAKVEQTIRYKWGFGAGRAGTVFGPISVSADGTRVEMTCCAAVEHRKEGVLPWAVVGWELATGRQLPPRSLCHESADSTQLGSSSPDGRYVGAGRRVLDARTGRVVATLALKPGEGLAEPATFSGDGRRLAAPVAEIGPPIHPQFTYGGRTNGPGQGVRVWDAATGRELARLPVPEGQAVTLSPDGCSVLALGDDLTVWDVATGRPEAVMSAGPSHTFGGDRDAPPLAVTPDGRFAVTAPPDGTALVWPLR